MGITTIILFVLAVVGTLALGITIGFSVGYDAGKFDANFERDLNLLEDFINNDS